MNPMKPNHSLPRSASSRRAFLKHSAAVLGTALAAPQFIPASVWGAEGKASPSNRLNIGMIGMGRQATYANIQPFLIGPDTQVVAVCDVDAWRLEQARKKVEDHYAAQKSSGSFKGCAAYRDFHELLARPDIDAVMISTPDHWHVPISLAAVQAGKDVSCEKPLTRNIPEGRRLSDLVRQKKRVFRNDSEFRSIAEFRWACELVRNGKIGQLQTIRSGVPKGDVALAAQPAMPVPEELDFDAWLGPAPQVPYTEQRVHPRHDLGRPGWMRNRDYCDGMILNWGTHLNDIAQWGNNTDHTGPVEVEGRGEFPPQDGLWNVLLSFEVQYRYANGVRLFYHTEKPYVRFEGSEGWVSVEYGKALEAQPESLAQWKPGPNDLRLPSKTDKRDFIDAVKSRGETMEDAEVGHRTSSLCHLGHLAIQLGQKLKWDPQAERFLGNDAANQLMQAKPARAKWQI
jgi:myo-inositol 2-dehydrogenase / D-chiro-inositol 1-dehydrogenase